MQADIFYYSGTGNSLVVAKELQTRMPGSRLVPIASLLGSGRIVSEAPLLGLVFPVYAFGLPEPLRELLSRLDMSREQEIFALATRGGSPCRVFEELDSLLGKKGKTLGSRSFIDMPSNAVGMHELDSSEEAASKEAEMKAKVEAFAAALLEGRSFRRPDSHGSFLKERILFPPIRALARATNYLGADRSFHADQSCTGCGICAEACLSGRIAMEGGRPRWRKEPRCHYCLACINYCPSKSAQIGLLKTEGKGRYHHEGVGYREIAAQKRI